MITLIERLFRVEKESAVWLKVPTNLTSRAEAIVCYEALTEKLEQILLNK
jgi:hypothetical protein|tara:strand:- start:3557 stop:3706 length:150 start_codon:yes stop_codon:yes gene_type:complete